MLTRADRPVGVCDSLTTVTVRWVDGTRQVTVAASMFDAVAVTGFEQAVEKAVEILRETVDTAAQLELFG